MGKCDYCYSELTNPIGSKEVYCPNCGYYESEAERYVADDIMIIKALQAELERRTAIEKQAEELIVNGDYQQALEILKTI